VRAARNALALDEVVDAARLDQHVKPPLLGRGGRGRRGRLLKVI